VSGVLPSENENEALYYSSYRRLVYRTAFGSIYYPTSRFRRLEFGLQSVNVNDDLREVIQPFSTLTGVPTADPINRTQSLGNHTYVLPSVAMAFDNTLFGYTGAFLGRRSRIEVAQSLGSWQFTQGTFDYRRYDRLVGPLTIASRVFYYGRRGRDAEQFEFFGGTTELIRGHTYGSYERNECTQVTSAEISGCAVNNLIGSQMAIVNVEVRIPLLHAVLAALPIPLPGIEGAVFYDIGLVWDNESIVRWERKEGDNYVQIPPNDLGIPVTREARTPSRSWGFSIRGNVLGFLVMRLDWANPIDRPGVHSYWTLSLGPTF
jgi:outer membrane protein assembly factor BamA